MSQKARTSYYENFDLKDITENKILSYCKTTFFQQGKIYRIKTTLEEIVKLYVQCAI